MTSPVVDPKVMLQVVVVFQDQEMRFWLPRDRPLSQILEAIINATPSPFTRQPDLTIQYDLWRKGDNSPLDLTKMPASEELRLNQVLQLKPKASQLRLIFKRGLNNEITKIAKPGYVIGIKKGEDTPDIDLTDFASKEGQERISRRHAEILLDQKGNYLLKVLNPNGVFVYNDRHYEEGTIVLQHNMRLLIVDVSIGIDLR